LSGARRRPPRSALRLLVVALLAAACGSPVPPIPTTPATASPEPPTPRPSTGRFSPTAYPPGDDAPCGQPKAPDPEHGAYTGNLKQIHSTNARTVVFELCRPDAAFLARIASPAFAINDSAWLRAHIAPASSDVQAIESQVNGTGPYRLESWDKGTEISLARNDAYWGTKAKNERLIVRWSADAADRIAELQKGTVDGIDDVEPGSVGTVNDDVSLQLATRPGLNVVYLGFSVSDPPWDNAAVRQAVALGIDRQQLVGSDFPAGSEVATHFTPCIVPHSCTGLDWYAFDPTLAKETLTAAGFPNGFATTISYSATPRPYLPNPGRLATDLQAQLQTNLGIAATLVAVPDATFATGVAAGTLGGIHLFSAAPPDPDVSAFLDPAFGGSTPGEFGPPFADIGKALDSGDATVDDTKRDTAYGKANDAIRAHIPMIPIAHVGSAAAFRVDVDGAAASPLHLEQFAAMTPGDRRQFVWLTTAEPLGLYCPDETDPIARLVCAQLSEGLYGFDPSGATGATPVPVLATTCDPSEGLTVWTCTLRDDVTFADGSVLDANDVVLSFAVQWDAEHPLHRGRLGAFTTFGSLFGGFLNPPPD
jgi:peptide/nickel transport system substrate-binding protein